MTNIVEQPRYIVYEDSLLLLFKKCPVCNSETTILKHVIGTFLQIKQTCDLCNFVYNWNNQPFVKSIPSDNLLLSASILTSGCLPEQALILLESMNCKSITSRTFTNHQQWFLHPAIENIWTQKRTQILEEKNINLSLVIAGDERADSPGHSAKYGSYTVLDLEKSNVLDVQLVQVG